MSKVKKTRSIGTKKCNYSSRTVDEAIAVTRNSLHLFFIAQTPNVLPVLN